MLWLTRMVMLLEMPVIVMTLMVMMMVVMMMIGRMMMMMMTMTMAMMKIMMATMVETMMTMAMVLMVTTLMMVSVCCRCGPKMFQHVADDPSQTMLLPEASRCKQSARDITAMAFLQTW